MTGRLSLLLFPIFAISQCLAISQCDTKVEKNIFLWSIKNPNFSSTPQGFLFGTIHVPFAEVWSEVSDRVREAFHVSDTVLLEIDLHDEDTIHELISCKNLAFEETVHSYLPPRLFQRIDKLMKNLRTTFLTWAQTQSPKDTKKIKNAEEIYNNITGDWWKKRPIWLLFLLYQMCENVFEKTSSPLLDLYIAQRAIDEKKSIIPIETAEEQCNPVRSVSSDDIIFAIEHTVKYLEDKFLEKKSELQNSKRGLAELINHYKCGTLKEDVLVKDGMSIIDYATEELEKFRAEEINRKLKEDIFLRRNIRMAKRIDGILKALKNHTIFSAIGAGHFFGDDSVLSHLLKNGYVIEKVKETDSIRSLQNPYRQTAKFKRVWTKESIVRRKSVIIEEVEPSSCSALTFYIVLIIATFFQLFHSIFQ